MARNAHEGSGIRPYIVTSEVRFRLVQIPGKWHFINEIFLEVVPEADVVYYFDPETIIKHSWDTFAAWARKGVVLVLDVSDSYMSQHHCLETLADKQALKCRDFTGYVNGGCVGVNRAYAKFAGVWSTLMEELEREGADMERMRNWTGPLEFARMDQDVLNATIMATDTPIALLSSEAMGLFPHTGAVMPHAIFHQKPWRRNYVFDAVRGFPPDRTPPCLLGVRRQSHPPFQQIRTHSKKFSNGDRALAHRSVRDL